MTTFAVVKDRAYSTLASTLAIDGLSLAVAAGEGARFPSTFPFYVSLNTEANREIVQVTNRVSDTLTVTRAQCGTSAAEHAAGVAVSLNLLAQHITDLNTAVNTLETGLPVLGGSHIIAADAPASVLTAAAILETLGYPVWVCDGVNDDIEIQAAIDALAASGGSIILSAGTFEIAAPISLNGVSQNKGINFRGQGQAATLLRLVNGVNGNMFERSDGVTAFFNVWRDMHLMGNQDNNINNFGI